MKKTLLSIFSVAVAAIGVQVVLTSSSGGRAFAASSGNTGAPSETTTCRTCHGTGFGATVSIVIKDAGGNTVTSYQPGSVYDAEFTVNANGASRYGFQMVSLNSSNGAVNGFATPAANTRLVTLGNGRQYAEHAGKSTTNTFSTKWTAPAGGTGSVTFYGGGAAVNNNGGTSGDGGNVTTLTLTEGFGLGFAETTLKNQLLVYPNPASNVIKIENTANEVKKSVAQLYTISGQLVLTKDLSLEQDKAQKLNTSGLENGYYLLRVTEGNNSMEEKIMIQN